MREPRYWRHSVSTGEPASALAVPVVQRDRVIAAISLVWPESSMQLATAVARYLPLLRETAAALSGAMRTDAHRSMGAA